MFTIRGTFPYMQLRLSLATFLSHKFSVPGKMSRDIKSSLVGNYSAIQAQNVAVDRQVSRVANGGYSSTSAPDSPEKSIDGAQKQTEYLFDPANDDDFLSLVASANISKNKRRTRLELRAKDPGMDHTCSPDFNASLRSNSASQPDESAFTSGFQKKPHLDRSHLPRIIPEKGEGLKNSDNCKYKAYDISLPESSKQDSSFSSGFQKKHLSSRTDRSHLHGISQEGGVGLKSSRDTECKTFDICLFDNRKQVVMKPSLPTKEQCMQMDGTVMENGEVLRPGMVLLRSYIPLSEQVEIISKCRELGLGSGGFYRPGYQDGAKLRLHMMCLGLDWDPQTRKYGRKRQLDNSKPPDIPDDFRKLVERVLHDSHILIKQKTGRSDAEKILPCMSPDICIVNFYTINGRLGLHQDRDESRDSLLRGLPVVSLSIGDSAEFLYGDERDIDKVESVLLESGDVLVFGGKSRLMFHGVTSIIPKTAPPALSEHAKLRPGRLNLTFRHH